MFEKEQKAIYRATYAGFIIVSVLLTSRTPPQSNHYPEPGSN